MNYSQKYKFFNALLKYFISSSESKELIIVAAIPIKMNNVKDKDVFQIAVNCDEGTLF